MQQPNTAAASVKSDSPGNTPTVMNQQIEQQTTTNSHSITSYVSAAKSTPSVMYPKKDQAVVMHAVEAYRLSDYVKALSTLTGPRNILFASRIANNRICIYLSSKEIVEKLVNSCNTIRVGDSDVPVRRLITPATRVIISNVSPIIPHEVIETTLKRIGLNLVSPASFLRAGIPGEEFSHILSFRRQIYISPVHSEAEIPPTILIKFDDTDYRIFLSTDNMECFICKKQGHVANNCPNSEQAFPELSPTSSTKAELTKKRPPPSSPTSTAQSEPEFHPEEQPESATTLPTPSQQQTQKPNKDTSPQFHKDKKQRRSNSAERNIPTASKNELENIFRSKPNRFSLPYEHFKSFIENSHGNSDPLAEARRHTADVKQLLRDMQEIYPSLPDKLAKNRFTRISKKIKNQLQEEGMEVESNVSMSSQMSQEDENVSPLIDLDTNSMKDPSQ